MSSKNSKESAYSSELEQYMDEQDTSEEDINFDEESNFQTPNVKSSKLDEYLDIDDEKEDDEEINYCSICGKELKKFNYGDKCDSCVKKVELVSDLNKLLDYADPSEELNEEILLRDEFDELKLNILVSNLLNEKLISLRVNGIFLADVKTLNKFFKVYGSDSDILDESRYRVRVSDDFADISKYSNIVRIIFNSKKNKWEVTLFRDRKEILRKYFSNIIDANTYATRYLNQLGELDDLLDKEPIEPQKVKYRRSKHEFVYFSVKRNKWYVKVKGAVRSKFVGFYDTEEEAVIGRDEYIEKKRRNQAQLRPKKFTKDENDAIISFHKRSNQWVVKVKKKRGGFKILGYYDTEDEAIAAKKEYYKVDTELKLDVDSTFSEGVRVQVISGPFEFDFGIIKGFNEERDSYIVKLENSDVPLPVFIKEDQLRLV